MPQSMLTMKKKVVWFSIFMHACPSVSIVIRLRFLCLLGSGGRQDLRYKGDCIFNQFRKKEVKEYVHGLRLPYTFRSVRIQEK